MNLVTVGTGESLIDITSYIASDDDCMHRIYRAQKNKLKMLYDFQKYYDGYATYYGADIKKVEGNTLVTSETAQFFATGMISWSMKFTYKDGKVKRTASQFTPTYEKNVKNWTAQRNLNLYQQLGSKTLAYTIKNGDVVQINKIIFKDFKVYFQVINKSGKIGYLTCQKTFQSKDYFKESQWQSSYIKGGVCYGM